jgi:chromosome segregation ATPase
LKAQHLAQTTISHGNVVILIVKVQRLESELAKYEHEGAIATKDVDGQLEQLTRQRDDALEQLEESKKHADVLLAEIESIKQNYDKQVTALQEEEIRSGDLASEKKDLNKRLKEAIEKQEGLQQQLKDYEDEKQRFLSSLQQSEKHTSELSADLEATRVENGKLLTELQVHECDCKCQSPCVMSCKQEKQLQIDQAKIEAERQYHSEVERLSGMTDNLERELQESKSRVCQLESQLADSVNEGTAQMKGVNDQLCQLGKERAEALIRLEESEKVGAVID